MTASSSAARPRLPGDNANKRTLYVLVRIDIDQAQQMVQAAHAAAASFTAPITVSPV